MRSAWMVLLLAAACEPEPAGVPPSTPYTAEYVLLNAGSFALTLDGDPVEPAFEIMAESQDALRAEIHALTVERDGLVRDLALVPECPAILVGEPVFREATIIYLDHPRGESFFVCEHACESARLRTVVNYH